MANQVTRDYIRENEERRKAIEAEERFLKKQVMGQGSDIPTSYENVQGDMERAIETTDDEENANDNNS